MLRATNTVHGMVVKGTAIESIAKHYLRSHRIPFLDLPPVSVGRVKFIPKQGYRRVDRGRGSFIAVILPFVCACTEAEVVRDCPIHYTGVSYEKQAKVL